MKVLVYGSKGWIGAQFMSILLENKVDFIEGTARVDNNEHVLEELQSIKPTHVISLIGRTHGTIDEKLISTIDYLEQPGKIKENVRDNLFAPLSLALMCKERDIHFTYLGTGCIFSYDEEHTSTSGGFKEVDKPNFFGSGYSTVKGYTDRLMHMFDNVLNLRIRMPIVGEDHPRNFITKITSYEKICSISNSMTVLPELLPCAFELMKMNHTGTINLTNPGTISHNEILVMYAKYVDKNFTWKNFSIEEQNKVLDSKRSNNLLDTSTLEKLFPNVKPIGDSVRDLMKNYETFQSQCPSVNVKKSNIINKDILDSDDTCLLVTGGAGFIGSNFINEFWKHYKNIRLVNLDALYYCASQEKC